MTNINNYINLKSYAKINLYLNILERLESGYHHIETIFQTISLCDLIYIRKIEQSSIRIRCNNPEIPVGQDSIVFRAVKLLVADKDIGLEISIDKKIPSAAGLGGGSSNVATILLGICKLFHMKITSNNLSDIAVSLGMDIPFFLKRGTVYATGKGENLFPQKNINPSLNLILINPGIKISTAWAYDMYDREYDLHKKEYSVKIREYLKKGKEIKIENINNVVYNCFEPAIGKKYPIIRKIKKQLLDLGAIAVALSGSGPTVFGIFKNHKMIDRAYIKLKNNYTFVEKTKTITAKNIFQKRIRQ